MNYRRGLQRIYVAVVVCWIAYIALLAGPLWAFIQKRDWPYLAPSQVQLLRLVWFGAVLILPPAFGYAVIFVVIPWIFRGFKPGTQI